MIDLKTNPSRRELRQFAGIWFPAFCGVLGGILLARAGPPWLAYTIWGLGALIATVGLTHPPAVKPVFVGLMVATFPIGWTVSHLVLAGVYYLVFTPIGLWLRLRGRDPMQRSFDRSASSYWIEREKNSNMERYFRQF